MVNHNFLINTKTAFYRLSESLLISFSNLFIIILLSVNKQAIMKLIISNSQDFSIPGITEIITSNFFKILQKNEVIVLKALDILLII
ncbi:MAG: hypothetical protein CVU41_15470 [Chloroflexi bacterium HGW-Chloroflexi-3]|nr:MAG: hypothetical protein CVU41_15470 [Chloroflexi bacterium HGW-Chloroflexi-3]